MSGAIEIAVEGKRKFSQQRCRTAWNMNPNFRHGGVWIGIPANNSPNQLSGDNLAVCSNSLAAPQRSQVLALSMNSFVPRLVSVQDLRVMGKFFRATKNSFERLSWIAKPSRLTRSR